MAICDRGPPLEIVWDTYKKCYGLHKLTKRENGFQLPVKIFRVHSLSNQGNTVDYL